MKSRKQIEDQMKDMAVPAGQSVTYRTLFDILLDIRDLLSRLSMDKMEDEVKGARVEGQLQRISEQLKDLQGGEDYGSRNYGG